MSLTSNELARLRAAYDEYEDAQLGRLNVTAERLRAVCKSLGWDGPFDGRYAGYRSWAKEKLGIT